MIIDSTYGEKWNDKSVRIVNKSVRIVKLGLGSVAIDVTVNGSDIHFNQLKVPDNSDVPINYDNDSPAVILEFNSLASIMAMKKVLGHLERNWVEKPQSSPKIP